MGNLATGSDLFGLGAGNDIQHERIKRERDLTVNQQASIQPSARSFSCGGLLVFDGYYSSKGSGWVVDGLSQGVEALPGLGVRWAAMRGWDTVHSVVAKAASLPRPVIHQPG